MSILILKKSFDLEKEKSKQKTESEEVLVDGENLSLDTTAVKTQPKKSAAKKSKSATAAKVGVLKFSHPDHAGTLKGHTSQVRVWILGHHKLSERW